ncbi:MAG: hypothetical protein AAF267_00340 [Deinococcota bacterium]
MTRVTKVIFATLFMLILASCAPRSGTTVVVSPPPFEIAAISIPPEIIINNVPGTLTVFWQGNPTPPLSIDVQHVRCPEGATCRNASQRVSIESNSTRIRYRCVWRGPVTENYDVVLGIRLLDNAGRSSQQSVVRVRCVV